MKFCFEILTSSLITPPPYFNEILRAFFIQNNIKKANRITVNHEKLSSDTLFANLWGIKSMNG
jgi:hypothetical protein